MGAACMAVILSLPEDYGAVMSYAGAGLMQFLWNLIPLLLFETSALGWKFSICRFLLNLPVVLVIGCAIERVLSDKDIEDIIQLLLR